MCLVKLPDELNIFSQYLHLKGFLSSVRSFFFLFFFFIPFFFLGGAAQGGGLNPLNPPPVDPRLPLDPNKGLKAALDAHLIVI